MNFRHKPFVSYFVFHHTRSSPEPEVSQSTAPLIWVCGEANTVINNSLYLLTNWTHDRRLGEAQTRYQVGHRSDVLKYIHTTLDDIPAMLTFVWKNIWDLRRHENVSDRRFLMYPKIKSVLEARAGLFFIIFFFHKCKYHKIRNNTRYFVTQRYHKNYFMISLLFS